MENKKGYVALFDQKYLPIILAIKNCENLDKPQFDIYEKWTNEKNNKVYKFVQILYPFDMADEAFYDNRCMDMFQLLDENNEMLICVWLSIQYYIKPIEIDPDMHINDMYSHRGILHMNIYNSKGKSVRNLETAPNGLTIDKIYEIYTKFSGVKLKREIIKKVDFILPEEKSKKK